MFLFITRNMHAQSVCDMCQDCSRCGRPIAYYEVGKPEDGKAIASWTLRKGQYLVVGQRCIKRCVDGWLNVLPHLWPLHSPYMHHVLLSHSITSLFFALLPCDVVALCFCFHILTQSHRDCSGSIHAVLAFVSMQPRARVMSVHTCN